MRCNKKNLMILGLILCIFAISIISASTFEYNTAINVRDSSNKELIIKTINTENGKTIKSIPLTIDSSGFGSVEFQTNIPKVMLIVYEIKNKSSFLDPENIISSEGAGPFDTNQAINLNFIINQHNTIPSSEPEINETEELSAENETITEESVEEPIIEELVEEVIEEKLPEETNNGLTGNVISDTKFSFKIPFYYYIIGITLFAMLIVSMILKKKLSKKATEEFKVQQKENKLDSDEEERELQEAEQKIKDAEEEINRIRNKKTKVRDAEKKFLESKAELEKLKKGE